MTYAIEYTNDRDGHADGPYRTGQHKTVAETKQAAERLASKGGLSNFVVRDNGDVISITEGNLVSELIDGTWHDRGLFDVENWWPKLDDDTRAWLLEHAEEQIPAEIFHRIIAVGGVVPGTRWEGQEDYDFRLPESAAAWIQAQRTYNAALIGPDHQVGVAEVIVIPPTNSRTVETYERRVDSDDGPWIEVWARIGSEGPQGQEPVPYQFVSRKRVD
jgi:hypothetical protein